MNALERSSLQVNTVLHDAGSVLRSVSSLIGAPRALLMAGAASAVSAFSRWRRSRQQPRQQYHAAAR